MELGPGVAKAFLAGAEGTEVLGCSGDDVIVEVEVDPAGLVYRRLSVTRSASFKKQQSMLQRISGGVKRPQSFLNKKTIVIPLTSLVGLFFASRTGPCQVTSK